MDFSKHPLKIVQDLLRKAHVLDHSLNVAHGRVNLSVYRPRPGYTVLAADIINHPRQLDDFFIHGIFSTAGPAKEVGIVSKVIQSATPEDLHLGFVDCVSDNLVDVCAFFDSSPLLSRYRPYNVYRTDRSYHVYMTESIFTQAEWLNFMGELLLAEDDSDLAIIDTRWVAHSLRRGYGVLRWTAHNKSFYQKPPEFVSSIPQPIPLI